MSTEVDTVAVLATLNHFPAGGSVRLPRATVVALCAALDATEDRADVAEDKATIMDGLLRQARAERDGCERQYQEKVAEVAVEMTRAEQAEEAIARVRKLHRALRIYDDCGHQHTDADIAAGVAKDVNDVGSVCEDGFMYEICHECCTDGGDYQTEACAYHDRPCVPCPTIVALNGAP